MTLRFTTKSKYIRTDGWRGYSQPIYAIAGSSDTGNWEDSPAPSREVASEIKKFQSDMRKKGFNTRLFSSQSSNVFMMKRWVIVPPEQYSAAKAYADAWLSQHEDEIQYIHGAD